MGLGLPREDVFAGVWVGCRAKLSDDNSVLCHGPNVGICPNKPEHKHQLCQPFLNPTHITLNIFIVAHD